MITSATLPKTESELTRLKKKIIEHHKQHQAEAQAIIEGDKTDDEKVLTLLEEVLTKEDLLALMAEEIQDITDQEGTYKDTHPNFSPLAAAIELANTYLLTQGTDTANVTISLINRDGKIVPEVGIVENAENWYRFTKKDIDFYLDRIDYFLDYLDALQLLQTTVQQKAITEWDKELLAAYLAERRDYWMEKEEEKAFRGEEIGEEQLYKAIFQAFIEHVVGIPTEE